MDMDKRTLLQLLDKTLSGMQLHMEDQFYVVGEFCKLHPALKVKYLTYAEIHAIVVFALENEAVGGSPLEKAPEGQSFPYQEPYEL